MYLGSNCSNHIIAGTKYTVSSQLLQQISNRPHGIGFGHVVSLKMDPSGWIFTAFRASR